MFKFSCYIRVLLLAVLFVGCTQADKSDQEVSTIALPTPSESIEAVRGTVENSVEENDVEKNSVEENGIDSKQLVGYWTADPSVSETYSDRYAFFDDGTFVYGCSAKDGESRERFVAGEWAVEGKTLKLFIDSQVTAEGGEFVKADSFVTTEQMLRYEEEIYTKLEKIKTRSLSVEEAPNDSEDSPSFLIDGEPFWKFDGEGDFLYDYHDVVELQTAVLEMKDDIFETVLNFMTEYPALFYMPEQRDLMVESIFELGSRGRTHTGYTLYDFEGDGVPEILMYAGRYEGGSAYLYQYINGAYKKVAYMDGSVSFYKDDLNRIVICEGSEAYSPAILYSFLTLDDANGMPRKDTVYYSGYNGEFNHVSKETLDSYEVMCDPHMIDQSLKEIKPVYSRKLLEEGRDSVKRQLKKSQEDSNIILVLNGKIVELGYPLVNQNDSIYARQDVLWDALNIENDSNHNAIEINGNAYVPLIRSDYDSMYENATWVKELNTVFLDVDDYSEFLLQNANALKPYSDYYWADKNGKETFRDNSLRYEGAVLYFDYSESGLPFIGIRLTSRKQEYVECYVPFNMLNEKYGEFDFEDDISESTGIGQLFFDGDEIRVCIQMTENEQDNPWLMFEDEIIFSRTTHKNE